MFIKRFAVFTALLLMVAACSTGSGDSTTTVGTTSGAPETTTTLGESTTTSEPAFPVTVDAANGQVAIEAMPEAIISLSPSATENLFAVGAGQQVVAVDDQSNYPEGAPTTDLSGFTPNLESILSYDPDLVVITFDPGGLIEGLTAVGVPVLLLPSATSIDAAFGEIQVLGDATGHSEEAAAVIASMAADLSELVAEVGELIAGTTIYHELDPTYYSVSSASYVGELYALLGLVNIADAADPEGFGYPQLAAEYIVDQDPDVILLADAGFGESIDTLRQRPGWSEMKAVANDAVIAIDPDVSSRWTPRSVVFIREVAEAIAELVPVG